MNKFGLRVLGPTGAAAAARRTGPISATAAVITVAELHDSTSGAV